MTDKPKLGVVPTNVVVTIKAITPEAPKLGVVEPEKPNMVSVAPVVQGFVSPVVLGAVVVPALPEPPPAFTIGPVAAAAPKEGSGEAQAVAQASKAPPAPREEAPLKISRSEGGGMAVLSILISTLTSRASLLGPLLLKLSHQLSQLPVQDVEIVVFEDQKEHTVGWKRNRLIDEARGIFVCFVDDDDDISDDYVWQLREAIIRNPKVDCVGFRGLMSVAGQGSRQVHYSLGNTANVESGGTFYRYPGHLTPVRKEKLAGVRFPDQTFGEDADFSMQLARRKCLKSEAFVDKVLYHYQFNPNTSETHPGRNVGAVMGIDRSIFHVIILSAVADNLRGCLDSILKNEPSLPRERIVVVDDGARADCEREYPGITWLKGEKPFVFARNANIGIKACPNDVILLNDDARLETKYGFSSMGFATKSREEIGICSAAIRGFVGNPNQKPWSLSAGMRKEQRNVAFVAVYIPRDTITRVGLLDECFVGYGFEDNSYCHRIKLSDLFIMIYDGCVVEHNSTENKSTYRTNPQIDSWMAKNRKIFEEKWPDLKMGPPPGERA